MSAQVSVVDVAGGMDLKNHDVALPDAAAPTLCATELINGWVKECDCMIRLVVLGFTTVLYSFYTLFSLVYGHFESAVVYGICCICSFAALYFVTGPRGDDQLKSDEWKLAIIATFFPLSLRLTIANAADGPHYVAWQELQEITPIAVAGLIRHSRDLTLYTFAIPIFVIGLRFKVYRFIPLAIVAGDAAMSLAMHAAVIYASPSGEFVSKGEMLLSTLILQLASTLLAIVIIRALDKVGPALARIGDVVDGAVRDGNSIQERELALAIKKIEFPVAQEGESMSVDMARWRDGKDRWLSASSDGEMGKSEVNDEIGVVHALSQNSLPSKSSEAMENDSSLGQPDRISAHDIEALAESRHSLKEVYHSKLQEKVGVLVHSVPFNTFVSAVLSGNMVVLALHADYGLAFEESGKLDNPFFIADAFFAVVYTVEIGLRLFACRCRFFRVPFNNFELFLVLAGNLDVLMTQGLNPILMRSLRMLRLTRMVKLGRQFRELRVIMEAILRSIRVVAWSVGLLVSIIFSSAIFTTHAIGRSDWLQNLEPQEMERMRDLFDSVPKSMYTLLQVVTLESWSEGIVRPIMRHQPALLIFFVPFVLLMTICVFNVVAAVIVDSTSSSNAHAAELERVEQMRSARDNLVSELKGLFSKILEDPGMITRHEWHNALAHSSALITIEEVGLTPDQTLDMFDALDSNGTARINVDRFVRCLSRGVESLKHIDITCLQANMSTAHKNLKEDLVGDLSRMIADQDARLEAKIANMCDVASHPQAEPTSEEVITSLSPKQLLHTETMELRAL